MVAEHAGRQGRPWRRLRAQILNASDQCWWCGHGGANAVDHLVARSNGGSNTDPDNFAPIHGREGCPVCPPRNGRRRNCNNEKGDRPTLTPPSEGSRPW